MDVCWLASGLKFGGLVCITALRSASSPPKVSEFLVRVPRYILCDGFWVTTAVFFFGYSRGLNVGR